MKSLYPGRFLLNFFALLAAGLIAGCASTSENAPSASGAATGGAPASKYHATDGRTIEIGKSTAAEGGLAFKNPHMDKCWIADGFNFAGYDALLIAPTTSTAKIKDDEKAAQQTAMENMPLELRRAIAAKLVFPTIALNESEYKAGSKILKLETVFIEYAKGGGGARYWAGLYGAGQPMFKVQGKFTDGSKTVCTFEARRSGSSGGSRIVGGYMRDEDIQVEDIRSLGIDLSDFVAAIAGKYEAKP
jgi:hypothetical protein